MQEGFEFVPCTPLSCHSCASPLPACDACCSAASRRVMRHANRCPNLHVKQTHSPCTKIVCLTTQGLSSTSTLSKAMTPWTRGPADAAEDRNSMKWNLASPCLIGRAMPTIVWAGGSISNAKKRGRREGSCSRILRCCRGRVVPNPCPFHHPRAIHLP